MEWLIDIIKEWVIAQAYATEAWVLAKVYATEAWVLEWITPVNVTGVLSPDITCTYFKGGTFHGKSYYVRADGLWFIWWHLEGAWVLSYKLDEWGPKSWIRVDPTMAGVYTPQGAATGNATVASGYKLLCHGFVDRGDPADYDWTDADLTMDFAWHDLDCSAIVPEGAKAILFRLYLRHGLINKDFWMRTKGVVNDKNAVFRRTLMANISMGTPGTVACGTDRIVQYRTAMPNWITIRITVAGWWL